MVSIPSCHDGYPGSIPGRRAPYFFFHYIIVCLYCKRDKDDKETVKVTMDDDNFLFYTSSLGYHIV